MSASTGEIRRKPHGPPQSKVEGSEKPADAGAEIEDAQEQVSWELPPEVQSIVGMLLPSDDPIDRPEFDPIDFINRNFPDEQSLGDIEPFLDKLNVRIDETEQELSLCLREQCRTGSRAKDDVDEAKEAIEQLFDKISDIRSKAEQSEIMVQEICRDIRQLDYAKRHLQTTITALKRLNMLVSAVDQLETLTDERRYREAANLLEAVKQLLAHFQPYVGVAKIVKLKNAVDKITSKLTEQVFVEFRKVGKLTGGAKLEEDLGLMDSDTEVEDEDSCLQVLADTCLLVEAIGPETRARLIRSFCADQLSSYVKLFGKGGRHATLEETDRRYAWFKRMMRTYDEKFADVFPAHWKMGRRLAIHFCQRTRAQLMMLLGAQETEDPEVRTLLSALQRTLAFEKDLYQRFEEDDEDSAQTRVQSEAGEKKQSQPSGADSGKGGEGVGVEGSQSTASANSAEDVFPTFRGFISGSFDPFMSPYISAERRNMDEMMSKVMSEESVDRDGTLPVFSSSVNTFTYIKNSVRRCTALTVGQPFFDLQDEFKRTLRKYAAILNGKLPRATMVAGLGEAYRLRENQEEDVCFVLNTAEYCAETLPQLEETVRAKISPAYAESIDMSPEIDVFHDVAATAVKCLVSGLEVKLDPCLATMQKLPWATWESVGDQSEYMANIGEIIQRFIPPVRVLLSSLYFRNFCDKFASSFLPRYLQCIFKCRRINEMATQQLLLDTYGLKTLMLQMPVLGDAANEQVPASYTRIVTREMSKAEMVLKLIGTPTDMLVQSFKILWPEGESGDLQKIMTVKGLRSREQQTMLETLGLQATKT